MRSDADGSNVMTVLTSSSLSDVPGGGIAFDLPLGHIYTANASTLFRIDLDGSNRIDLVGRVGQFGIGDVEVDLVNRKVYWTEVGGPNGGVRRADLDGSNVETLATTPSALVEGIALDPTASRVYFTLNGGATQSIEVMNLDGSARSSFKSLVANAQPHDVEIDLQGGWLYWNEFGGGANDAASLINRTALDGLGPVELVSNPTGITGNGIHYDSVQEAVYFQFGLGGATGNGIGFVRPDGSGLSTPITRPAFANVNYMESIAVPEPTTTVAASIFLGLFRLRRSIKK